MYILVDDKLYRKKYSMYSQVNLNVITFYIVINK